MRKKAKKKETLAATAAEIIAAFVGEDLDDDDDAELNKPHEAILITSNGHFAKASSCVYEGNRLHGLGSPEHV